MAAAASSHSMDLTKPILSCTTNPLLKDWPASHDAMTRRPGMAHRATHAARNRPTPLHLTGEPPAPCRVARLRLPSPNTPPPSDLGRLSIRTGAQLLVSDAGGLHSVLVQRSRDVILVRLLLVGELVAGDKVVDVLGAPAQPPRRIHINGIVVGHAPRVAAAGEVACVP